jgi:hypothetical protein
MSGMENDAKPLLISMFNAQGAKVVLDEDAQITLARWAFKTIAVLSQVDYGAPIPLRHRREFRQTDRPPQAVYIRIGTASITTDAKGEQLAQAAFQQQDMTMTGKSTSFPFYRAAFRLLNVAFDITGYDAGADVLAVDPGSELDRVLLPLWPAQHPRIWWPPVESLDTVGGISDKPMDQIQTIPAFMPPEP